MKANIHGNPLFPAILIDAGHACLVTEDPHKKPFSYRQLARAFSFKTSAEFLTKKELAKKAE